MLDKIVNNNLRAIFSLISSYIKGMSEWFWSYMISVYLLVLFGIVAVSTLLFGGSVMLNLYTTVFALVLGVHVYMSFTAVIHDYIYNRFIVNICTSLLFLVVLGVLVEVLKN